MITRFIGVFALVLIPIGIYLFFFVRRTFNFWVERFGRLPESKKGRIIYNASLAVLTGLTIYTCTNVFRMSSMIVMHILLSAAVIDLVRLIVRAVRMKKQPFGRKLDMVYRCGLVPVIITTLIMIYGVINIGNVVQKDYTIYTNKNIRSEGYKIALVSDLHLGNSMDADKLAEAVRRIEDTNPDMLLLCGDIFDESSKYDQLQKATQLFGSMKSTYGTFYVYGNHDEASYRSNADYTPKQLEDSLRSNNIRVLADDVYKVNDEFTIVGRADAKLNGMFGEDVRVKSMSNIMSEADTDDFILMMDHQPVGFETNREFGIDLQLSGHTHAGQIWPIGIISELFGFGELNYGYKKIGDFQVIVSSGISGWGYPIRTSAHSEYVIVSVLPQGN